jgi:transcriptional regulator with XRE-family HTH domain
MKRYKINRGIRHCLGLSSRDLSKRVEVSAQTISNYERGKSVIRPVERVIEIELDMAIEACQDSDIKEICKKLQLKREEAE